MPRLVAVPATPLIAAGSAVGDVPEAAALARAARETIDAAVTSTPPGAVVHVLDALAPEDGDERDAGTLAGFGVDVRAGAGVDTRLRLGPGHTIGAWLLDGADWTGARRYVRALVADEVGDDDLVVVVADGSACRTQRAPGHLHPEAAAFDAGLAAALATGDAEALEHLDAGLAVQVWCRTAPTWHRAGAAVRTLAGDGPVEADLVLADAPLGVGWFVALWSWT